MVDKGRRVGLAVTAVGVEGLEKRKSLWMRSTTKRMVRLTVKRTARSTARLMAVVAQVWQWCGRAQNLGAEIKEGREEMKGEK